MANRRGFLKMIILGSALAPLIHVLNSSRVWAAKKVLPLPSGMNEAPASDPVATAIGYKADIKDIDYVKYPQRKKLEAKNQFCKNCSIYTSVNDSWGKCQMIAAGLVAADGWCGSWSKKG